MSRAAYVFAPLLAGCAGVLDAPATSEASQAQIVPVDVGDCDPLICPGNSNLMGELGVFELSLTTPVNKRPTSTRGFKITNITYTGGAFLDEPFVQFKVTGASLWGQLSTPGGPIALSGPNLVGTKIRVQHTSGVEFDLRLTQYTRVPFYDTTQPPVIDGYMTTYQQVSVTGAPESDMCPYKEPEIASTGQKTWAVFWKGDRYNPDTGQIYASGPGLESQRHVGDWFNISCAGEATIKMLRAETGQAVKPGSPVDLSQATLNMFTAKYCPDPTRYTILGQKLTWEDTWSVNQPAAFTTSEAIWTSTGAACLDTPRMVRRSTVACDLPHCDKWLDSWESHGVIRSVVPVLEKVPPVLIAPP